MCPEQNLLSVADATSPEQFETFLKHSGLGE